MNNEEQIRRELEQLRNKAAKNMHHAELQGVSSNCQIVTPEEVVAAIAAGFLSAAAFRQSHTNRDPLLSDNDPKL